MSATTFVTGSDQTVKYWSDKLKRQAPLMSFWNKFTGENDNAVIKKDTRFQKMAGDQVKYDFAVDLSGAGYSNSNALYDNEEAITFIQDTVLIFLLRNAVTSDRYSNQLTQHQLRKVFHDSLARWYGERFDDLIFKKLSGVDFADHTPTALGESATALDDDYTIFPGGAVSTATLTDDDVFDTTCITRAKEAAVSGYMGANATYRMKPIIVDGMQVYMMVIHPWQAYDLKQDEKFRSAQENAAIRGSKNPIFTGALGMYDGVVIYEHNQVVTDTTYGIGSNVKGAIGLFCGAGAGYLAICDAIKWDEQVFDYNHRFGVSVSMFLGFDRTVFTRDYGCIPVISAAKSHAMNA